MLRLICLIVMAATLAISAPLGLSLAQNVGTAPRIQSFKRFEGETKLRPKSTGAPITPTDGVNVDIRNWIIGGGNKMDELPLPKKGLMIVQLRGGEVTTIINGERRERREGEFWTVPAGVRMGIETDDDSAILQTIVVLGQ